MRRSTLALAACLAAAGSGLAEERYVAVFASGARVTGREIRSWHGGGEPSLEGQRLFDPADPVRWVLDTSLEPAEPRAFVELAGGDRLPGRTVAWRPGTEAQGGERRFPHFLVEPDPPVDAPEGPRRESVRVLTRWARRVVWERRGSERLRPGTAFLRDGQNLRFRSLRWGEESVRLLLADRATPATQEARFPEIAELHLLEGDPWAAYFETLGALTPSLRSRVARLETDHGIRRTTSLERLVPRAAGPPNDPRSWRHCVQPAWSLDPLWLEHRRIRWRRFFAPHEVPLSAIAPAAARESHALGGGWPWRADASAQGGPLRAGGLAGGWGLGVHARSELELRLRDSARRFRARAGLDEAVGRGGCARPIVLLKGGSGPAEGKALYRGPVLTGSERAVDTGWLDVARDTAGRSGERSLVLVVDAVEEGHPAGADPLDIRDTFDWIEPLLELGPGELQREVRLRMPRLVAAWQDWTLEGAEWAPLELETGFSAEAPRWWLGVSPVLPFLKLMRSFQLSGPAALALVARRDPGKGIPARARVVADGEPLGDFDVPAGARWCEVEPVLVPLPGSGARRVTLEVYQVGSGGRPGVEWRALEVTEGG
ncbi:MAG: NPCBM/NEW2 domain-containing protein [Planctomycetes bacterium]|nr:NPCBM/NEW2 domain-containing protein [Planctomycetota bacterium]